MGIDFSNNAELVHNTDPTVSYGGYLEIKQGNKVIGRVDATFDFREMPPEYHSMALQMIMQGAKTLQLPDHKSRTNDSKTRTGEVKEGNVQKVVKEKRWFGLF